jgi:hypothetical protein
MPTIYEAIVEDFARKSKTIDDYSMRDIDEEFKSRLQKKWGWYLTMAIAVIIGVVAYNYHLKWYYIAAIVFGTLFLGGIAFIRIPTILFDSLIAAMSMIENRILKNSIDKTYSDYTYPTIRLMLKSDNDKLEIISLNCKPFIDIPRKGEFIHLEGLESEMVKNRELDTLESIKIKRKDLFSKSYEVEHITWHPFSKVRSVIILLKDEDIALSDT